MKRSHATKAARLFRRHRATATLACALTLPAAHAFAQIDASNWGLVTAPVYGTTETAEGGIYSAAELFAGPNKFGSYYNGVLPNGRIVKPAGISTQIGMNPLGSALTPDGKFLLVSNDDERDSNFTSLQSTINKGGYSLSVYSTASKTVVSQIQPGTLFVGLQIKSNGDGTYTAYASAGASSGGGQPGVVRLFTVSAAGVIAAATPATIAINPITPSAAGFVSNYTPKAGFPTASVPSGFSAAAGAKITFPAGSALSPNGQYLYVACNGDNSLAVIDTTTNTVIKQIPVGYFPYGVSVSRDGTKVLVSNWGVTEYKFKNPVYDNAGLLTALPPVNGNNQPDGFYVPVTNTGGQNPKTSSVSVINVPGGNPLGATLLGSVYQGQPLDVLYQVGDTHPSATGIVRRGTVEVLYVAKANSDSLGLIVANTGQKLPDFDLSPIGLTLADGHKVHGSYPNAIVVSPDNTRVYVAEAGLNSVAVLDTTSPTRPRLLGRIPTGWYPTSLSLSGDGKTLFVTNAKGIGEDINPLTNSNPPATGVESYTDGNFIFGSVQQIDLGSLTLDKTTALGYNYAVQGSADTSVVPLGGKTGSGKIKHVVFILHENKTFDSMLGNQSGHFGNFASLTYNNANATATGPGSTTAPNGSPFTNAQNTSVSLNLQSLALSFATGVNYYSDSEESDAGHQFCASGTATDYTEKTLLVKSGRGLLVNKNFEPEDYPEGGYIFNNAARNGIAFKDYGAMIRIEGTDTGTSVPTTIDDPLSGNGGYPTAVTPTTVTNVGDVTSAVSGLGQTYFLALPIVAVLGTNNPTGEPRLDRNYPGYNFNISDQRRALEFIKDFDRMAAAGTLPQYLYIYQPNDHTGGTQYTNVPGATGIQEIADGDVALGMVVSHLMNSKVYYDAATDTGSAIFITFDDAQSSLDHIHEHRTPVVLVSPFSKTNGVGQGFLATRHYVTASIVKTEELLMGLPPNNLGDLFATDMRDMFQPTYNGITASALTFNKVASYTPSPEHRKLWALVKKLDTSAPDRDSRRLGYLNRLCVRADGLHTAAAKRGHLHSRAYQNEQAKLYAIALKVVNGPTPARDSDD